MSTPVKHHYVPESYLKAFANEQKQIWKRKKDSPYVRKCSPAQICYEIDAYKIRTNEALNYSKVPDPYFIEKVSFKKQENNYPKIRTKVTRYSHTPFVVDNSQYRLFLETLLTIKRRNPQTRSTILSKLANEYGKQITFEEFKKGMEQESNKYQIPLEAGYEDRIKEYLQAIANSPDRLHDSYLTEFLPPNQNQIIQNFVDLLYRMKQVVLHSPTSTEFITSDNPGFTISNGVLQPMGGFGNDFKFYFPLSPQTCLYISSGIRRNELEIETTIYPTPATEKDVRIINSCTKAVCTRHIVGHRKSVLESV